jgi:hypothetical protein
MEFYFRGRIVTIIPLKDRGLPKREAHIRSIWQYLGEIPIMDLMISAERHLRDMGKEGVCAHCKTKRDFLSRFDPDYDSNVCITYYEPSHT